MSKKILILYTSVGLGHKSLAENIGYYLQEDGFDVRIADIGKVQKGKFESIVTSTHRFINQRLPFIWGCLYSWGHYLIFPFRVYIAGFNYKSTKLFVDQFKPDLIISTQTASSAVVAFLKQKGFYKGKFGIAFSDFHLHPYWLYKEADFYLANIGEQKEEMVRRGISGDKIYICGMTLKPKEKSDKNLVKNKYGIDSRQKLVLIASGSQGFGVNSSSVALIDGLAAYPEIKVIVLCGKNLQAFEKLSWYYGGNKQIEILSYHPNMDELYSVADIFISKPGGLSVAEALRWHLPILISHLLPGQEKLNLKYLLGKRLVMPKDSSLTESALNEVRTGRFRLSLTQNVSLNDLLKSSHQLGLAVKQALD